MPTNFRQLLQSLAPVLASSGHKGQAGRIAVIGGCQSYTGAPYFAAITTMKLGTDLTTVYCTDDAGTPIKSYSPDLMVDPILHTSNVENKSYSDVINQITSMIKRCNSVIIGCGLGKNTYVQKQVIDIIKYTIDNKIPLVIDGDGLSIINDHIELIHNTTQCIITPNAMEFYRLYKSVFPDKPDPPMNVEIDDKMKHDYLQHNHRIDGDLIECDSSTAQHTAELARALGNITIVRKGQIDLITNGMQAVFCCSRGGLKRVGGQGDVTAGM